MCSRFSKNQPCPEDFGRKPAVLSVIPDAIPAVLKQLLQWGAWRFEKSVDETTGEIEWDKIPRNAVAGYRASSTNPRTWSTFDAAIEAYERGGYAGLAFFLRTGGGLVGIDLDKCRNAVTGVIEPWALGIVGRLQTYTELSPSGRGLHSFLWGELPPRDRREGHFECYSSARCLTITGHRLDGTPATVEHRQAELLQVHAEIFAARIAKREAASSRPTQTVQPCSLGDVQIIDRASHMRGSAGQKFRALWSGDINGYRSHSEADLALCGYLAFFVGQDPARIDELFRGSGLYRGKWNRADYRDATIAMALEGRTDFYKPRPPARRGAFQPGVVYRKGVAYVSFEAEV
jgi:primase-polymerase (primpol)-like protein